VHPIDVLFYLDILLVDIIPCRLFGVYQPLEENVVVRIKKQLMKKAAM